MSQAQLVDEEGKTSVVHTPGSDKPTDQPNMGSEDALQESHLPEVPQVHSANTTEAGSEPLG